MGSRCRGGRQGSRLATAAIGALLLLVGAACGSDETETEASGSETEAGATSTSVSTEESTSSSTTDETTQDTSDTTDAGSGESDPPSDGAGDGEAGQAGEEAAGAAGPASPESQAAMDAWSLVFDSSADFADKAPHLEDAAALEASNQAYQEAGASLGGISLEPSAAAIDGDTATVTYDVLFGDNAAYNDLDGTIVLTDGTWTVSRDEFCGFLASARTPCE